MIITTTCGHKVFTVDDLETISLKSYDRMDERCVSYVSYCKSCAHEARIEGRILSTEEEEMGWLDGKDSTER